MKRLFLLLFVVLANMNFLQAQDAYPRFSIKYGPWVQNVTETSFTVVWCSPEESMAFVEVAPDDGSAYEAKERTRFYDTVMGRRVCSKMHKVTVTGLEPGKRYRYRVIGRNLIDDSDPYRIVYGKENNAGSKKRMFTVKTYDYKAEKCRFSMVNDQHQRFEQYKSLMESVSGDSRDFVVLNGDIVSYTARLDTNMHYTFGPIKNLACAIPSVFVIGNHESRGHEFYRLPEAYPTPTGEFYYTFRQGPAAFIVLNAAEDKPDHSVEYSDYARFDEYRKQQLEWLKKAVQDPLVADAPVKICLMHIPAIADPNSWYGQLWANEHFVPVLNEAGVDLMLSGHHHKFFVREKGSCGNDFPILSNSNLERLECEITQDGKIRVQCFDIDEKKVRDLTF